jgi:hypothetical protein
MTKSLKRGIFIGGLSMTRGDTSKIYGLQMPQKCTGRFIQMPWGRLPFWNSAFQLQKKILLYRYGIGPWALKYEILLRPLQLQSQSVGTFYMALCTQTNPAPELAARQNAELSLEAEFTLGWGSSEEITGKNIELGPPTRKILRLIPNFVVQNPNSVLN